MIALKRSNLSIIISMVILSGVVIGRGIYTYITGFMTGDEALYYLSGLKSVEHGQLIILYPSRYLFQIIIVPIFMLLKINDVHSMIIFATIFAWMWTLPLPYIIKKITEIFTNEEKVLCFSTLAVPFFPILTIMSATFVTEPMSVLLVMMAIYFQLLMIKKLSWKYAVMSGLMFALSSSIRDPYMLLILFNGLLVFAMLLKKKIPSKIGVPFILTSALGYRIPFSLEDILALRFTQTIITSIMEKSVIMINKILSIFITVTPIATSKTVAEQYPAIYAGEMGLSDPIFNVALHKIGDGLLAFFMGLFIGWNPIFTLLGIVGLIISFSRLRKFKLEDVIITSNIMAGFLNYAIVSYIISIGNVTQITAGLSGIGTIIRTSHTSLPAMFSMRLTLAKLNKKHMIVIFLIVIVFTGISVRYAFTEFQKGWSGKYVERLTLNYRDPHYRLYEYTENTGKTLIFGGHNLVLPQLYLRSRLNVYLSPPVTEEKFLTLLKSENWDTVLIYGYYHYPMEPALKGSFPWYLSLMQNETEIPINVIWDDGESFLYEIKFRG